MQKQKIYETPDGKTIVATFYNSTVAWRIQGKPDSSAADSKESFWRRVICQQWKEVK